MSLLVISMGVQVMPEGHVGYMQITLVFRFWRIFVSCLCVPVLLPWEEADDVNF